MVVFPALTWKLPIQTLLSLVPELPVSLSSHEKYPNFRKTSTPLDVTDNVINDWSSRGYPYFPWICFGVFLGVYCNTND